MSGHDLVFDPTHPTFLDDPYPMYRALRESAPVVWIEDLRLWVLSRYADVAQGLRDPRLGVNLGNAVAFKALPTMDPRVQIVMRMFEQQMLFRDPPEHTRLRGLVNKAFTPRVVEQLRPHMERLVNELLDQVEPAGKMDLIADLAFPLPVTVIAVMLGVPTEDHDRFSRWSQTLAYTLEPVLPPEALYAANQAAVEILDYFRSLVSKKRAQPEDDLLSALIQAEEQGQRLTQEELLANAVLLLVAGHETTVNLIGNGVLALLRHRDQLERFQREPDLIETAIEELLRYDSPAQMTTRIARETISLDGQTIQAGQEVMLLLGSGNRDPDRFHQPDQLDLGRLDCKHLSFGGGPHYCVGAPLARAEGQIALSTLVRRFPNLQLADPSPPRRPSAVLRGLRSMPLQLQ
jgi:hypothetical protein